jgi:transcriptional regulator with XRE-family HTH domain
MSIPFDPTTAKALGGRIRAQRIAAGISLDDFATAIGVTAAEVSLIEDGATRPAAVHLVQISRVLGVKLSELLRL